MKISYNANGLRSLDIRSAVSAVAGANYDGIELSLHPQHIDIFSMNKEEARDLSSFIRHQGIEVSCLATGYDHLLGTERFEPSLIHPDRSERQRRLDALRRALDVALWMQVPVVGFASGILRPGVSREAAFEYLAEGTAACLDHCGGALVMALEPEPGFLIESNAQALDFIDQVGSEGLRLNQDIGHENVYTEDYLQSIEHAIRATAHIHVEDIKGRHHHHEIPGDGDIDFAAFGELLRESSYDGYLSVELYNHSHMHEVALDRSLQYLRSMGIAALVSH